MLLAGGRFYVVSTSLAEVMLAHPHQSLRTYRRPHVFQPVVDVGIARGTVKFEASLSAATALSS